MDQVQQYLDVSALAVHIGSLGHCGTKVSIRKPFCSCDVCSNFVVGLINAHF